jgi:putative ABC transport system permease protein
VPPRVRTIESIVASSVARPRFILVLVGVFGGVALLLAALGVYSVISYLVTQRGHELGIRVALGARATDILRLVLREGAGLAASGIAVGAVVAVLASRLLASLLYATSAVDPVAFGGVVLIMAGVALIACWVPARRASRAEVMTTLRRGTNAAI